MVLAEDDPPFGRGDQRRARIARWAEGQVFQHGEVEVRPRLSGVECRIPVADVTTDSARVLAEALRPTPITFVVEPRATWRERLLGRAARATSFEARWRIDSASPAMSARLVDDGVRAALMALPGWARVSYERGRIDVEIEAKPMRGARLLEAVAVAVALARVDPLAGI